MKITHDKNEIWKIKDKKIRHSLYAANNCGRIPVTAQFLYENPDTTGYLFSVENDEFGLDPWITINGLDMLRDGSKIILEYGAYSEKKVDPNFIVFIQNHE